MKFAAKRDPLLAQLGFLESHIADECLPFVTCNSQLVQQFFFYVDARFVAIQKSSQSHCTVAQIFENYSVCPDTKRQLNCIEIRKMSTLHCNLQSFGALFPYRPRLRLGPT
jgi:hypothetical protein